MSIWIRSQDKETLVETRYLDTGGEENTDIVDGTDPYNVDVVAHYKTEQRALEVMDEIEHFINGETKQQLMFLGEPITTEWFNRPATSKRDREQWAAFVEAHPDGMYYTKADYQSRVFQMPAE